MVTQPSEVWRSADAGRRCGSRRADWRHCRRRQRGLFRRDRILITFAGSRATRSNLNDFGLRLRQARSSPRSMVAAPGATALLVDRGTLYELAVHRNAPRHPPRRCGLRASLQRRCRRDGAARRSAGLDVAHLRSVAIHPGAPQSDRWAPHVLTVSATYGGLSTADIAVRTASAGVL